MVQNYCVAVSSGIVALHLSMIAIGLKKRCYNGINLITFAASAVAALHLNCKIILVDIDKISKTIDACSLEKKLKQLKKKNSPKSSYCSRLRWLSMRLEKN